MHGTGTTSDSTINLQGSLDLCCKLVQMLRMFPEDRAVYLPILERLIEDTCVSHPRHAVLATLRNVRSKSAAEEYHWAMRDLRDFMTARVDRIALA